MDSVLAVALCLAVPVAFSYHSSWVVSYGQPLQLAQNVHWRRRLQHVASGLVIASSYKWVFRHSFIVVALLGSFCAILWAVHVLRRRLIALNELYLRALGPLLRPHEVASLPGAFWFVLGSAIAIALFPQDIALQSIVHLSVGDPVASVVGISLGHNNRLLPSGKSLAGTFAAFLACAASTWLLFGWSRHACLLGDDPVHGCYAIGYDDTSSLFGAFRISSCGNCSLLISSILGGVSGCVAEVIPFPFDDNLSLPVVSGIMFLTLYKWQLGTCQMGVRDSATS